MVDITQEELDRLRALEGTKIRERAPLGEGEGLAARTIADYLRQGDRGQQRVPRRGGPLDGGLSYGGGGNQRTDYHKMAAERGLARDAGASIAELQAADAVNRQTNEQNPFGYNKRQTAALENAWKSSPDRVALEAQNVQRAKQGLPPIQSSFGLNRYHTNPDGSRDYNYSADGQYRGAIPEKFRNAPGNANTHDAHFNKETGQWEAGDLSLMQTFKDIGQGAMDAYGNIRNTIPLMGAEVVDGVKGLAGKFGGGNAISGGGKDGVGNFGAVGDFFGGIGDQLGLTSYGELAAKKAAEAPLGNSFSPAAGTAGANADAVAAATAKAQRETDNSARRRKATSNATQAQKAKQATTHTNKAVKSFKSGTAPKAGVSGFNMGGPISLNYGGVAQSQVREQQIQQAQRAANAPQIASSGPGMGQQIAKKAIGSHYLVVPLVV